MYIFQKQSTAYHTYWTDNMAFWLHFEFFSAHCFVFKILIVFLCHVIASWLFVSIWSHVTYVHIML